MNQVHANGRDGDSSCHRGIIDVSISDIYSVSQKSSPPPPKLFAVFSLMVNRCNWKYLGC